MAEQFTHYIDLNEISELSAIKIEYLLHTRKKDMLLMAKVIL